MKNKISIYLNMLIICLSICVISVGVYSLTSANLTISGSLGYVYHDKSSYTITATIQNYTTTEAGTLQTATPLAIGEAEPDATAGSEITKISLTDKIYFKGTGYGSGNNIEVLVTGKNNEDTQKAVVLLFDDITGLGYTRKVASGAVTTPTTITDNHSEAIILSTKDEQTTFRLTLKQSAKKTNLSIAQVDFNIQLSVADYDTSKLPTASTGTTTLDNITYTINADRTGWSATSHSVSGDVTISPLVKGLPVNTINGLKMESSDTLTIPNSVTDIASQVIEEWYIKCYLPGSLINICDNCFWDADGGNISELTNNNYIYNFETIGKYAFAVNAYYAFTELELQSEKLNIASQAFQGQGLTSIIFPSSATSISIESIAFVSCKFTSITFPSSVTSIGDSAFWWCESLTTVTFEGSTPPTFGSGIFSRCSVLETIYVPSGAGEAYKTAENFSEYAGLIQEVQ